MKAMCFIIIIFLSLSASAQQNLWSEVDQSSVETFLNTKRSQLPSSFRLLKLNDAKASELQKLVPQENAAKNSSLVFKIPLNKEDDLSADIVESNFLSPELQKQNPSLKTYRLSDPVTKNLRGRISILPSGITGLLFTEKGIFYVSPLGREYPGVHMIFDVNDLKGGAAAICGVTENAELLRQQQGYRVNAGDCQLRTFRLAVAATAEYYQAFGSSQPASITAITNTINIVNAIYERDVTVRFTLVTNNSIIYTNANTDPYIMANPAVDPVTSTNLSENQAALDAALTNGGYDLGIVFHAGWGGGLASVGVVCNNSSKGRAAAGLPATGYSGLTGPIFATTVAHEIAHQFSATHTFSATNRACSGNTSPATAYEAGAGSTVMAYAGACDPNFYQAQASLYFHGGSIAQIQNYIGLGNASCAIVSSTGNIAPVVTVTSPNYTIPISTPFSLTATGTDADGNTLKYTWEQMNAGFTSGSAPQPTNTAGPNFRSYSPTTTPTRYFPSIESLVTTPNAYEVLPSVARTMSFRVTARDEASGGGCTAEANVAVVTNAAAGPFLVTSQNSPVTLTADGATNFTVTWDVSGTTGGAINCPTVDILFSTDGGYTFQNMLLANTPNDGTEAIVVPNLPTLAGRVKVQAHNNIFYNINTANITINSACIAEAATFSPSTNVSATAGSASLDLTLNPNYGAPLSPAGTIDISDPVTDLSARNTSTLGCNNFDQQFYHETIRFYVTVSGNYTFTRTGGSLVMNLYNNSFLSTSPCANFITSNLLYTPPPPPPPTVPGTISLGSGFTATLSAGTPYTITIGSFNATTPALPAAYSISITPPAGGNIYAAPPNPGAGYSYTYVIVENATGLIKAIDAGADLSNSGTYPSGTFTIYGLSYSTASAAALPAFVGGSFTALQNSLLFNPSATCGNLSKNIITASIQSALPVKLLPLKAYKIDKNVLLKWGTEFEQNADRYEIERSSDGINFTTAVGTVKAKGNSNTILSYDFTDQQPADNLNYYRVKQFDIDGKFSFTNVAKVDMKSSAFSATAYPSPATSILTMEMYSQRKETIHLDILDSKGSLVSSLKMDVQQGINTKTIDVNRFARGIYVLRLSTQSEVTTLRFVKN